MKKACLSLFQHILIYFIRILSSGIPPVELGFPLKRPVSGLPKPPFITIFQISVSQLLPPTGITEFHVLELSTKLDAGCSTVCQKTSKAQETAGRMACVFFPLPTRLGYLRTLPSAGSEYKL